MEMIVTSLELSNIRRFPESVKFDFTDKSGNLIEHTFILMANGTGKTTTITLIKGLLDGTADNWSPSEVSFLFQNWINTFLCITSLNIQL